VLMPSRHVQQPLRTALLALSDQMLDLQQRHQMFDLHLGLHTHQ
jgi:hypothetical protein